MGRVGWVGMRGEAGERGGGPLGSDPRPGPKRHTKRLTTVGVRGGGAGTFKWASGNLYDGELMDGKKHGQGGLGGVLSSVCALLCS